MLALRPLQKSLLPRQRASISILSRNSISPCGIFICSSHTLHRPVHHPQRPQRLSMSHKDHSVPLAANLSSGAAASVDAVEGAKRRAAQQAVADHYDTRFAHIGIGSGSTVVYVVEAIKAAAGSEAGRTRFVPTGTQSRGVIEAAGLQVMTFDQLPSGTLLDVCFDGADEVDADLNCIKGGGACLYQEKLVATHARKFVCVADHRKRQDRLLTTWPTIPIEVEPLAVASVVAILHSLGAKNPQIRQKNGANLRTDQDNFIVDAPFPTLLLPKDLKGEEKGDGSSGKWEVRALAHAIKMIEGVLSVGIFSGPDGVEAQAKNPARGGEKPVAAYFGMQDQSVVVRQAGKEDVVL